MAKKGAKTRRPRKPLRRVEGFSIMSCPGGMTFAPDDAAAEVAATYKDRARFAACPDFVAYVRDPEPGEMRAMIPPGFDLVAVEVRQIRPGVRARRPIFRRLGPGEIH